MNPAAVELLEDVATNFFLTIADAIRQTRFDRCRERLHWTLSRVVESGWTGWVPDGDRGGSQPAGGENPLLLATVDLVVSLLAEAAEQADIEVDRDGPAFLQRLRVHYQNRLDQTTLELGLRRILVPPLPTSMFSVPGVEQESASPSPSVPTPRELFGLVVSAVFLAVVDRVREGGARGEPAQIRDALRAMADGAEQPDGPILGGISGPLPDGSRAELSRAGLAAIGAMEQAFDEALAGGHVPRERFLRAFRVACRRHLDHAARPLGFGPVEVPHPDSPLPAASRD